MRSTKTLPLSVCAVLALSACAIDPPRSDPPGNAAYRDARTRVQEMAKRFVAQTGTPGLSLVIVDGEQTILAAGFGVTDRQDGKPATVDTIYRAGSVAKLFTATAVMQQALAGQVDLDRHVDRYLPEFSIRSRFETLHRVTARQLMSHSAGLPSDLQQGQWSDARFTAVAARLQGEFAAAPPGRMTTYSNVGYSLLGHLVERTSGVSFEQYVAENLFAPLGMHSSAFAVTAEIAMNMASGHRGGERRPRMPIRDVPAMALHTSAADLGRYMQWLFSERTAVLPQRVREQMWAIQNHDIELDFDARMGLGWSLDKGRLRYAGRVARHGGHTPLYSAELIVLPDHRLGIAVLANSGDAREMLRLFAEVSLQIILEAKTDIAAPRDANRPPPTDAADLPAGRFATELGILRIDPRQHLLWAETLHAALPLEHYSDSTFGVPSAAAKRAADRRLRALGRLRFSRETVGGRELLVVHRNGQRLRFGEAVQPPAPNDWTAHVGEYEVLNDDRQYPVEGLSLERQQESLYLCFRLPAVSPDTIRLPILPLDDDEAIIAGFGRGGGETIRIEAAGQGRMLHYSGYRALRAGAPQVMGSRSVRPAGAPL